MAANTDPICRVCGRYLAHCGCDQTVRFCPPNYSPTYDAEYACQQLQDSLARAQAERSRWVEASAKAALALEKLDAKHLALVERVRVLEEYLRLQATCGCCGGVSECTPECTLADDDPDLVAHADYARSLLPQRQPPRHEQKEQPKPGHWLP